MCSIKEKGEMCLCQCAEPRTRCQVRWYLMAACLGQKRIVEKAKSSREERGVRPRQRGHWRDRVMDECREEYWEVGEEIIWELSFAVWQRIQTHSWPFDAEKMLTVFPPEPGVHCSFFSAAKVSSFRFSHWFSWNWRQPGFSLHLWKGRAGCGSCDSLTGSAVSENRETCHAFILCTSGRELKQLLCLVAVIKVLICFLWRGAESRLALRIAFQPKGSKHHIPAAHLYFYTNRRNSRCYHGVPSERWQWAFYRDQWDGYITPHCDFFLHFCA